MTSSSVISDPGTHLANHLPLEPEHAGEWALLAEVTASLAQEPDLDKTLSGALRRVMALMNAEAAGIFLFAENGEDLIIEACAGPADSCERLGRIRLPAGTGIVARAARATAPVMVRDVRNDPDFAAFIDEHTGFVTRSLIAAPLRVAGERLGAIEVVNKTTGSGLFNASDAAALSMLATAAALAIRNARMTAALVEQERMHRELELAREIQRSLLPVARADSPLTGINLPAREVSGDFYDFHVLGDGRIAFNLADVSGKGLDAALLGVRTASLLRGLGRRGLSPGELLAVVNDELCETATRGMFVTVIAGVFDPVSGELRFANAGHPPPLLLARGTVHRLAEAEAPPLGILPGQTYGETDCTLGDARLYLYSDGLSEARDAEGRVIGIEGVMQRLTEVAGLPVVDGLERLTQLALADDAEDGADTRQRDDVTVLCVDARATQP